MYLNCYFYGARPNDIAANIWSSSAAKMWHIVIFQKTYFAKLDHFM